MAYQKQDTQALTALTATAAQTALDQAQIDPRLIMAAKAIQLMAGQDDKGNPKISADMALAAAMYQAGTGQLLGRDFYVNEKIGRMEGYRGVSRDAVDRGVGEVQIKYRALTNDEIDEHEIASGDTCIACEVYQLRAWRLAQEMGQRYEPIVGIGVIRKVEKYDKKSVQRWDDSAKRYVPLPESGWRFLNLEGGMTWGKKARNRAYKEALRHVPGGLSSAAEVLEEATLRGMTEQPPEAARLSVDQAIEWAKQHEGSDPDWDGIEEGEFVEVKPAPVTTAQPATTAASNGNGAKSAARPHWDSVDDAVLWGYGQGCFKAPQHAQNAYNKLKHEALASDTPPANAKQMFDRWFADVLLRLENAAGNTISDAELDGTDLVPAVAGEGDDEPQF